MKPNTRLTQAMKKLARLERTRLTMPGGRIARRSARRSFFAQLAAVRKIANEVYPPLPRSAPEVRPRCAYGTAPCRKFALPGDAHCRQHTVRTPTRRIEG